MGGTQALTSTFSRWMSPVGTHAASSLLRVVFGTSRVSAACRYLREILKEGDEMSGISRMTQAHMAPAITSARFSKFKLLENVTQAVCRPQAGCCVD